MREALIVFAKVPRPGTVKTRLTPPLSAVEAADLYEAFLLDSLDIYRSLSVDVRLYLVDSPRESESFPELEDHFIQSGNGLGGKMLSAFSETFASGYDSVCIIGTDHPTLPIEYILQGYQGLRESDVVIGQSDDGGFYMLGMTDSNSELFVDMTYSHEYVYQETVDRAAHKGLSIHDLPPWYDVDDADALRRLVHDLDEAPHTLRRTRNATKVLADRYSLQNRIKKTGQL